MKLIRLKNKIQRFYNKIEWYVQLYIMSLVYKITRKTIILSRFKPDTTSINTTVKALKQSLIRWEIPNSAEIWLEQVQKEDIASPVVKEEYKEGETIAIESLSMMYDNKHNRLIILHHF